MAGPQGQSSNRASCLACSFREWQLVLVCKQQPSTPSHHSLRQTEPCAWTCLHQVMRVCHTGSTGSNGQTEYVRCTSMGSRSSYATRHRHGHADADGSIKQHLLVSHIVNDRATKTQFLGQHAPAGTSSGWCTCSPFRYALLTGMAGCSRLVTHHAAAVHCMYKLWPHLPQARSYIPGATRQPSHNYYRRPAQQWLRPSPTSCWVISPEETATAWGPAPRQWAAAPLWWCCA